MRRYAGVLMHISSLPSNYGIGTLGKSAYDFADFLHKSGQSLWQVLPIGPTGFGDSPYQSFSVHAGNPYFIDLDMLCDDGLLKKEDCTAFDWGKTQDSVDYEKIYKNRFKVLKKAFENHKDKDQSHFNEFKEENSHWLDDYALYMAVKSYFNMISWHEWPDEAIRHRTPEALKKYSQMLSDEIEFFIFLQYLFYSQWKKLKKYVNALGIKLIGDMPIYVGLDSADTWSSPEIFLLDENKEPIKVAGCPPDAFSEKGQLWGNPIYHWDYLKQTNYAWWIERFNTANKMFDITRIDHFRGFDSYYAIPADAQDATVGEWLIGPGVDIFNVLKENFENLEIIAEDLGFLTPSVERLLEETGFPGMKILQFAFDRTKENVYLPHNYQQNSVVYTGTHDNDTIIGWWNTIGEKDKNYASEYCVLTELESHNWGFIRVCYASVSKFAIVPMQDFLGLGSQSRMNIPSTQDGNWTWRLSRGTLTNDLSKKMKYLVNLYGRA